MRSQRNRRIAIPNAARTDRERPFPWFHRLRPSLRLLLLVGSLSYSGAASAQDAAQYFRQNCASCHTIGGGRLTGPDLKNVADRRDRQWLTRFILDPSAVLQSGDPYAAKLQEEARGVVMPKPPGITRELAERLLDLIAAESKLERSQFAGSLFSDKPFTAADVAEGKRLFLGTSRLASGGTSCISCHAVRGIGALGGGRLGPDLTRVYERLQGKKNLSAWLSAPATATMQATFQSRPLGPEEIHALVAFFEDSAKHSGEEDMSGPLAFLLLGIGGAALGLVGMDAIWRSRFHGVRRFLTGHETR
ncbi:MAG: c-type cytochrome [Pirellulales bacterium]|nr:c-type cytochrome [Pirellulales bacterium]